MKKDSELLSEYIVDNNFKAFEEIVLRYQKMVYSVCLKALKNQSDAQDAAQVTFLALIKKARSLRNKDSLSSWLYKAAIYASNKIIRTDVRLRDREENYVMQNENIFNDTAAVANGDFLVLEENALILQNIIASLPERYRIPIIRHYFEEKSSQEIADDLGIDRTTAAKRISRGVEKIRQKVGRKGMSGISIGVLTAYLSTASAEAVPAGLTTALCNLAATGTGSAVVTTTAQAVITTMEVAKMKMIIGSVIAAAIVGVGGYSVAEKIINNEEPKKETAVAPMPAKAVENKDNEIHKKSKKPYIVVEVKCLDRDNAVLFMPRISTVAGCQAIVNLGRGELDDPIIFEMKVVPYTCDAPKIVNKIIHIQGEISIGRIDPAQKSIVKQTDEISISVIDSETFSLTLNQNEDTIKEVQIKAYQIGKDGKPLYEKFIQQQEKMADLCKLNMARIAGAIERCVLDEKHPNNVRIIDIKGDGKNGLGWQFLINKIPPCPIDNKPYTCDKTNSLPGKNDGIVGDYRVNCPNCDKKKHNVFIDKKDWDKFLNKK